jgi:hypothetical protein
MDFVYLLIALGFLAVTALAAAGFARLQNRRSRP